MYIVAFSFCLPRWEAANKLLGQGEFRRPGTLGIVTGNGTYHDDDGNLVHEELCACCSDSEIKQNADLTQASRIAAFASAATRAPAPFTAIQCQSDNKDCE